MPSRATYSYIPKKSAHGNHRAPEARAMNILDDGERQHLLLAGQLSRIVCRKLEVEAYRHLQKLLNDASGPSSSEILPFVQNFGRILVTLRWRVSWWTLLGDGGKNPDAEKEAFEARVKDLCRILYFYYCRMRSKIPSFHSLESLKGIYSSYADTSEEVFDDFPGSESIEGFERWMRNGELLIEKAGVVKKLDRIGLRSERF